MQRCAGRQVLAAGCFAGIVTAPEHCGLPGPTAEHRSVGRLEPSPCRWPLGAAADRQLHQRAGYVVTRGCCERFQRRRVASSASPRLACWSQGADNLASCPTSLGGTERIGSTRQWPATWSHATSTRPTSLQLRTAALIFDDEVGCVPTDSERVPRSDELADACERRLSE